MAALFVAGVGGAVLSVVVLAGSAGPPFTTYGRAVPWSAALDVAAGLALLGAGAYAWGSRGAHPVAIPAVLAGVTWYAPGLLVAPLAFPVACLTVVLGLGRREERAGRALVATLAGVGIFVSLTLALVRDPFLDPWCWSYCGTNVFLAVPLPGLAGLVATMWAAALLGGGVGLAGLAAVTLMSGTTFRRLGAWPMPVAGVLLGIAYAAYGLALLLHPAETPDAAPFAELYVARASATLALGIAIAIAAARSRRVEAALLRLTADLRAAPPTGALRATLAEASGDADIVVLYWLPSARTWADEAGRSVDLTAVEEGRAVSFLRGPGGPVLALVSDAALQPVLDLESGFGSALRLAAENERLHAEVLRQLADLRASRASIVASADAERRRLERNLHDGAQQRLLALRYELRQATEEARAAGDAGAVALFEAASATTREAFGELRRIATGIFPASLSLGGLRPALATFADESPIPVDMLSVPDDRFPETVETTLYLAITDATTAAAASGATFMEVIVERDDDDLRATLTDDGQPGPDDLVHVADRLGAVGGRIEAPPPGARLVLVVPCAS
jgi:signal transduction histidine kinase